MYKLLFFIKNFFFKTNFKTDIRNIRLSILSSLVFHKFLTTFRKKSNFMLITLLISGKICRICIKDCPLCTVLH